MKVLVTGGAGFIGSHLVRQLIANGDEVYVLDNLSTGNLSHLPRAGFTFWKQDIRDNNIIQQIIFAQFDAIVHLAAQTMVDASIKDPEFDATENILGTIHVLEAARKSNVRRVIFASTAAAYGDVAEDVLPIRENEKLKPMSFYGLSKVTVEKYLALYNKMYGLNYVICRFANVYGERQGDSGEGGVISIFAKRIANGQDITIFGDGEQTRDFVYAGDIAAGICKALVTAKMNTVYNLSTQTETSLNELVDILGRVAGCKLPIAHGSVREGDIYRSMLSNEKAVNNLMWKPAVGLLKGLQRTYDYFVKQG